MKLPRVTRLIELLTLLQAGRGHNAQSLAECCGVSRRTIFRDLEVLRQAGVPLRFDEPTQSFFLTERHYLPPTSFTPQEALALVVLCHELGNHAGLPFYGAARSAALKIESTLPAMLRDELRRVGSAIEIQLNQTNPLGASQSDYESLVRAIARRRAVRIRYQSFSEQEDLVTKLLPYRLLFSRRSWYVIGRSSLHRQVRTFNVGRILQLERLDERYEIPTSFSLDRYLRNAWHLIPEPGPDVVVCVRFDPLVAGNVSEVSWHKTQRIENLPDGSIEFYATVSGIQEISWWILGYGAYAEVLAPESLRELVSWHANRLARRYAELPATLARA